MTKQTHTAISVPKNQNDRPKLSCSARVGVQCTEKICSQSGNINACSRVNLGKKNVGSKTDDVRLDQVSGQESIGGAKREHNAKEKPEKEQ